MRIQSICVCLAFCAAAFGQSAAQFEIASIQFSAKSPNPFPRTFGPRNGRYEIHTASMVDLIQIAWGFGPDRILGGPSWLEMDRFDIVAKVPDKASQDDLKPMLQCLLTDRFKLAVHKDSRPLPTYALTAGKKVLMKEADGSGDSGCRVHAPTGAPAEGGIKLMMNGSPLVLGPGGRLQYSCRNMTMESFAAGLRNMLGVSVGGNPVIDKTGLAGKWNFDVKWSLQIQMNDSAKARSAIEQILVVDALEKQLGLKLEQEQVATPVLVVDSANETPTADSPEVSRVLPVIPLPTAFEVADIRPSDPDIKNSNMRVQANGRFTSQGLSMQTLLLRSLGAAGGLGVNADAVAGIPKWAETARFDITAKAPADTPQMDMISVSPLLRSLFEERFGMKTHTEERPLTAYTLVTIKPKMKKADPESRAHCIRSGGPAGSPPGTQVLTCQNITMAQFADQLRNQGPGLSWPVLDSTALTGGWDFTLTFSTAPVAGPDAGDAGVASDPTGGFTLFEAIERQLGLKLEMQKRPMPVTVIDRLEEKPTDN
jgi:uncharacterized protein (TIGR03435 family)